MKETAVCTKCGNKNEVKVSTGHNKPENKGKKYFTCAGCSEFQWVEAKTVVPVKEEVREPVNQEPINRIDPKVWDAKDRTSMAQTAVKAASDVIVAMITSGNEDVKTNVKMYLKNLTKVLYEDIKSYRETGVGANLAEQVVEETELPF